MLAAVLVPVSALPGVTSMCLLYVRHIALEKQALLWCVEFILSVGKFIKDTVQCYTVLHHKFLIKS
jgi:hypothetical protein